jgi:hypothetical protein|tara:strand:- start:130 stop:339 length:210 start_codon:yes stop_codon:yes gene_type:complete
MNLKVLIYFVMIVILLHFGCYFFNIDLLECFEKKRQTAGPIGSVSNDEVDDSIDTLTQSLEQLKEMTDT